MRCLGRKINMKKLLLLTVIVFSATLVFGQEEITKNVSPFNKIVVSPKITLVLEKGDKESVRIVYSNISTDKINIEVTGHQLSLYLDDARMIDKRERRDSEYGNSKVSRYEGASVTAYVTYRFLNQLEMRGQETLTCEGPIEADKFKLKLYGEAEVSLAALKTNKFKASLYGVNRIKIKEGESTHQVYRLFGENKIDTRGLVSTTASARVYGEGRLSMKATDEVRINAFGEPEIIVSGNPHISRGIIIGKSHIDLRD